MRKRELILVKKIIKRTDAGDVQEALNSITRLEEFAGSELLCEELMRRVVVYLEKRVNEIAKMKGVRKSLIDQDVDDSENEKKWPSFQGYGE